jgi:hypothetical protein
MFCKYIITISVCSIDDIHRVELCRIQIKIKCVQISEIYKILFELVEGYVLMPSSCLQYERTLCILQYDFLGYFRYVRKIRQPTDRIRSDRMNITRDECHSGPP